MPHIRPMKGLWLTLVPSLLGAQVARNDSVSAPIHDVRYDVTFMRANAQHRVVDVAMTFTTAGTSTGRAVAARVDARRVRDQQLSLAGSAAFDVSGDGKPLVVGQARLRHVAHSPGRREVDARDVSLSRGHARQRDVVGEARLPAVQRDEPLPVSRGATARLSRRRSRFTRRATGASRRAMSARADAAARTRRRNYHDLVDMPFFVGRFDLDSARIVDRWVRLATYPAGAIAGGSAQSRVGPAQAVIPPEIAVFGETPWESYTVMQIVDSTYGGASGLEHQSSHVDILAPSYVGERVPAVALRARDLSLVEREAAASGRHVAIPLFASAADAVALGLRGNHRLLRRPRRGARRRRRREGVLCADGRRRSTRSTNAAPVSLEDASLNTWMHPVDGTEYIYYPEGVARRTAARHHDSRRERQRAFARRRDARPLPVGLQARARLHGGGLVDRGQRGRRTASRSPRSTREYIDGRDAVSVGQHSAAGRPSRAPGDAFRDSA